MSAPNGPQLGPDGKPLPVAPEQISLTQVVQAIKFLAQNQRTIGDQLAVLVNQPRQQIVQAAPPAPAQGQRDLEQLSRAEFAEHLLGQIKKELIAPLYQNILEGRTSEVTKKTEQEVMRVAGMYDNFWDFQEEMKSVYAEHPNLSVEDAYVLAQKRAPHKVEAHQAKLAEAEAAKKKDEDTTRALEFGGLMPTSTRPQPGVTPMSQEEAVADSWDKHMAPFVSAGVINPN